MLVVLLSCLIGKCYYLPCLCTICLRGGGILSFCGIKFFDTPSRNLLIVFKFTSIEILLCFLLELVALQFKSNNISILELNELVLSWFVDCKLFHLYSLLTYFPRTKRTTFYGRIFSNIVGFWLGPFLEK